MLLATLHDLDMLDSTDPWIVQSPKGYLEYRNRVVNALTIASSIADFDFTPEGPSDFQDGSVFMCAQEYLTAKRTVLSGLYFSKYGNLLAGGRNTEESRIRADAWPEIFQTLSQDHGFLVVPSTLLDQHYEGRLDRRFRCETWWDRFFAAWYMPQSTDDSPFSG